MNVERYIVCGVTGDRSEMASCMLLRVTPYLLGNTTTLLEEVKKLQGRVGGTLDVTKRADIEFWVLGDLPEEPDAGDPDLLLMVENGELDDKSVILPFGFDGRKYAAKCGALRTELHGIQVWAHGNIRLTCYPREASYRIESARSIHTELAKLGKDFNLKK
jgi:hypothetical protein